MKASNRTTRLAAALLGVVSLAAVVAPAHAEDAARDETALVDTRTTGSVRSYDQACDPNAANAGIVCRVTKGDPEVKFPAAPVNPAFGF